MSGITTDTATGLAQLAIDLSVEDGDWARIAAVEDAVTRAARAAVSAVTAMAPMPPTELSMLLTSDARIRELNRDWRGQDKPTNVLSFPADAERGWPARAATDPPVQLGDIVLGFETVRAEAEAAGKPLLDHIGHLVVHGILHLVGHDHEDDDEAEAMERLETVILARLGIADPYADRLIDDGDDRDERKRA